MKVLVGTFYKKSFLKVLQSTFKTSSIITYMSAAHPGHGARTNNPPNDSVNYLLLAPALNNKLRVCVALIKHPSSNGTCLESQMTLFRAAMLPYLAATKQDEYQFG